MGTSFSQLDVLFLQRLLQIPSTENNDQPEVILTLAPNLWKDAILNEDTILVDLSVAFRSQSRYKYIFRGNTERKILTPITSAGWPMKLILVGNNYGSFAPNHFQITILDEAGDPILLYINMLPSHLLAEILLGERESPDIEKEYICKIRNFSEFPFYILSLHETGEYLLLRHDANEPEVLSSFPTPDMLGVKLKHKTINKAPQTIRPSDITKLVQTINDINPQKIIFDFSFLESVILDDKADRSLLVKEFQSFLSGDIPQKILNGFSSEYGRLLGSLWLYWFSLPELQTLVMMLPSRLLVGEMGEAFREPFHKQFHLDELFEIQSDYPRKDNFTILSFNAQHSTNRLRIRKIKSLNLPSLAPKIFNSQLIEFLQLDPPEIYESAYEKDVIWTADAYAPNITELIRRVSRIGPVHPLGAMCVVIDPEEDESGDLIIPQELSDSWEVLEYSPSRSLSENDTVLRISDETLSRNFLLDYLNTGPGRQLVRSRSLVVQREDHRIIKRIYLPDLLRIPVPFVSKEDYFENYEIQKLEMDLHNKIREVREKQLSTLESQDKNEFKQNVRELQRFSHLIEMSIHSVEDLRFQIQNFFPYPLAYGYRLLSGIYHPLELYREQLRIAENILAFLGSISLALLNGEDLDQSGIDFQKVWSTGVTPGNWRLIVQKSSEILHKNKDELSSYIVNLNIKNPNKGFGALVEKVIRAKNDFKHDRTPSDEESIRNLSNEFDQTLLEVMKSLAFFTDFPIRQVRDMDYDRNSKVHVISMLRFSGDHPGLSQEEIRHTEPFSKGEILIRVSDERWINLNPFMTTHLCPTCHMREIYFVDRWDLSSRPSQLKSFERGHTIDSSSVSKELANRLRI